MAAKTERIELRTDQERERRIRYAAELEHQSVSAFVLDAASDRAERVISSSTATSAPGDFFDLLWQSLDARPTVNSALNRRARSARRITQR